ncbi:MAG: hypothetical protein M1817_002532 [Caeruleum heppii]|nr:MAG: hypothetical protein M1817_002532 [Caeruleum heppii]
MPPSTILRALFSLCVSTALGSAVSLKASSPNTLSARADGPFFNPLLCKNLFYTDLCVFRSDRKTLGCYCDSEDNVICEQRLADPSTWAMWDDPPSDPQTVCGTECMCSMYGVVDFNGDGPKAMKISANNPRAHHPFTADNPSQWPTAKHSRPASDASTSGSEASSEKPLSETCAVRNDNKPCTCGGRCSAVTQSCSWGSLGLCRCTARPFFAGGGKFFGECASITSQMGGKRRLARDGHIGARQNLTDEEIGSFLNATETVVNATDGQSSGLFNATTFEQVACPCNQTYVSYACCESDSGIIYEEPHKKLGELILPVSESDVDAVAAAASNSSRTPTQLTNGPKQNLAQPGTS